MPNWVFNTVHGYDNNLMKKYSNGDLPIDFNKIIPEPEEITNTISGSFNSTAKEIYSYKVWKNNEEECENIFGSPLYDVLRDQAKYTVGSVGELCLQNPDKSLNQLIEDESNEFVKDRYKNYISLFGNKLFGDLKEEEFLKACDTYCDQQEEGFKKYKETWGNKEPFLNQFETLIDYAKYSNELIKKYGTDNWYDWRCVNWGTKWNASDIDYDEESDELRFDTAWSVPEPIFAKIAQDNPDKSLDIYSEEESGWFVESKIEDGKFIITATGEYRWDEESDESIEERTDLEIPIVVTYDEIKKKYEEYHKNMIKMIDKMKIDIGD